MFNFFLASLGLFIAKSQYPYYAVNSPQLCYEGDCVWNCPGIAIGAGTVNCKDIFYCGPNTKSCVMNCGKGGCNSEMAIISHSASNAVVNCLSEGTCTKMLVNCGRVNPEFIQTLSNLPGSLADLFQNYQPYLTPSRGHKPYGKCMINCGHKSCHDLNFICQGSFADGGGCELNAQSAHPTFENGYYHCALPNRKSHCSCNCGMSFLNGQNNAATNLYHNPFFGGLAGRNADFACQNAVYACFQGSCYCDGIGCSKEIQRNGIIRNGKPPRTNNPSIPKKPKSKTAAITKKPIEKKPIEKKPVVTTLKPIEKKPIVTTQKPKATKKPIKTFVHYLDQPLYPGRYPGYTHYECGVGLSNCQVVCETFASCSGKTIVVHSNVDQLTVTCAEYGCIALNVNSNAIYNEVVCVDECACSGATINYGTLSKTPQIAGQIEKGIVTCKNTGCAKCHAPTLGLHAIKGTTLNCGSTVMECELHADSQSAKATYTNIIPRIGQKFVNHPLAQPQGSFDGGVVNCNVQALGVQRHIPQNPFLHKSPMQLSGRIPKCKVKCSTHISRRYCGGVKYNCNTNPSQCQCQDFCTQHANECYGQKIASDCPERTRAGK